MANGPFGNPLSTGIALSFEVDMTPYREMHKRKLLAAEEKKQQRAKQQKELQDILKNVTVDTSKIHDRYKDDAMNEYASTINDIMSMYKEGNVSGVYQRINKFNNGINSYVDATENFKAYVKSDGSKTFKDENIIRAFNDVENVSEKEFTEMSQADADYSNGVYNFVVTDRVDADAYINKLIQGVDKDVMYDPSTGQPVVAGRLAETGRVSYKTGVSNAKDIEDRTLAWFMSNGQSAVRTLMSEYGLKPGDLDSTDESGQNMLEKYARDYVSKRVTPKLYGQTEYTIPKEKESKGWTFGGGGAKSPNWEVNKVSNIPVSLTDEVGGSLSGWKVDYTKQTGQKELQRSVELGKGAYFAEGGKKIHKISDSATGMGMVIEATPAGVYVRDDKQGGQVWAAYETNYMPPKDDLMKGFKFDPNKPGTEEEQKQAWINISIDEDEDRISKTKRIVYVPLTSENEKIEFRTAMGMSADEFDKLLKEIGASPASGTQSSESTTSTKIKGIDKNIVRTLTETEASGMPYKYGVQEENDTTDYEDLRVSYYDDKSIKNLIGYREGTWWYIVQDGKYPKQMGLTVPDAQSRLIKGSTTSEDVNYNFKDFERFKPSSTPSTSTTVSNPFDQQ